MNTFVKLLVLAILAPLWWPVIKALYVELDQALWREGGFFGRKLSPKEIEALGKTARAAENPMVSEPWAEYRRRKARGGADDDAPARSSTRSASGPIRSGRRRGF